MKDCGILFSLHLLILCLCQEVLPSLTLYPEGAVPLGHAWLRVPSLMPSVAGGSDFGSFVLRCWVPLCCSRFRFRLVPVVPLALPVCGLVCPLLLLLLFCSPSSPPSSSSADSFGVGLSCGCWGAVGCGPPSSPSPPHLFGCPGCFFVDCFFISPAYVVRFLGQFTTLARFSCPVTLFLFLCES